MTRPRSGIGSELLVVILVPVCLAGSLALIMATHRRAAMKEPAPRKIKATVPIPPPVVRVEPPKPPAPPPARVEPPVDPTKEIVARLALAEHEQKTEARRADRRAEALEVARREATARSQSWKHRVMAVRAQVDALSDRAETLEKAADALALQRDALARERDASRAALAKARTRSSYAIQPHKGPNGTWRRPIVIECRDGTATLQPRGPSVSLLELSPLFGARSNPLISAVARELVRSRAKPSPDGSPAIPYIYFVVRPDGIRPYYEARSRLEPLGIAFGYELVEQDWEIDYPDPDDPGEPSGGPGSTTGSSSGSRVADVDAVWPLDGPRRGASGSKDSFLWPTEPRQGGGGPGREDSIGQPGSGDGEGRGLISSDELRRRVAALERASDHSLAPRPIGDLPLELGRPAPEPRPLGVPLTAKPIEIPGAGAGNERVRGDRPPELPLSRIDNPGRAGEASPRALGPGGGASGPRNSVEGSRRAAGAGEGTPGRGGAGIEPGSVAGAPQGRRPVGGPASNEAARPQGGRPGSGSGGGGAGTGGGPASDELEDGDIPFEIDVACGPDGLVIHPGGYLLSLKAMREQDGVFVQYLETTVHLRRQLQPTARLRPRVRFLVEVGGSTTYWEARRQTVLSGLDWPVTLRAADSGIGDVFSKESW